MCSESTENSRFAVAIRSPVRCQNVSSSGSQCSIQRPVTRLRRAVSESCGTCRRGHALLPPGSGIPVADDGRSRAITPLWPRVTLVETDAHSDGPECLRATAGHRRGPPHAPARRACAARPRGAGRAARGGSSTRAQQHLRPVVEAGPPVEQRLVRTAPGDGVDDDHRGRPLLRSPGGDQVDQRGHARVVEQHGAEQLGVHHLRCRRRPGDGGPPARRRSPHPSAGPTSSHAPPRARRPRG